MEIPHVCVAAATKSNIHLAADCGGVGCELRAIGDRRCEANDIHPQCVGKILKELRIAASVAGKEDYRGV